MSYQIRIIFKAAAILLLTCATGALAEDQVSISANASHDGDLATRNGSIRIAEGASVSGSIASRNGQVETGRGVTAGNVSTRNGAIELGNGGSYGRIESRNGQIMLGDNTTAGEIQTRNGNVRIGPSSQTGSLDSRNGSINAGSDVVIDGTIQTRNGNISLASGSRVTGRITTRSGDVLLDGATAEQGIQTLAGDITLDNESRSGADLTIDLTATGDGNDDGLFSFLGNSTGPEAGSIRVLQDSAVDGNIVLILPKDYDGKLPVVEISAGSSVGGNLRIDSRIELIVEGKVAGQVERVSP